MFSGGREMVNELKKMNDGLFTFCSDPSNGKRIDKALQKSQCWWKEYNQSLEQIICYGVQ